MKQSGQSLVKKKEEERSNIESKTMNDLADRLPRVWTRSAANTVANTDEYDRPGKHWIAFYIDEHGSGTYFDSYGIPPHSDRRFLVRVIVPGAERKLKELRGLSSEYLVRTHQKSSGPPQAGPRQGAAEATRNINTVFGEGSASERTTRRWFKKFWSADTNLDTLPRGMNTIEANPRTTVREIAGRLSIHHSTVVRHLKTMEKVKKLDKWVPHKLTEKDKMKRLEICTSLLSRQNKEYCTE
nr:PREDICTED: uncharacterized protein LOC105669004 [Linepithema humile]